MIYQYKLTAEQRIDATSNVGMAEADGELDFPDEFDFDNAYDYKIIDGALVHEPVSTQTPMTLDDVLEYATDIDMRLMEQELGM